jgi:hypothetical protein
MKPIFGYAPVSELAKFLTMKVMRFLGYKGSWEELDIDDFPI